eukprot:m.436401 g.436401  ORF g.436401 m.436401 type:complete len:65 (-) comp56773_c0_seq15:1387-1581(-)
MPGLLNCSTPPHIASTPATPATPDALRLVRQLVQATQRGLVKGELWRFGFVDRIAQNFLLLLAC